MGYVIARETELSMIDRCLRTVAAGPHAVLVEGDMGTGKTAISSSPGIRFGLDARWAQPGREAHTVTPAFDGRLTDVSD